MRPRSAPTARCALRDQVIAIQTERIAAMDRLMLANLNAAQGNAQAYLAAAGANNEIKARQAGAKKLLEEFQKLPDYGPAILFRMAKVYYDWNKKWEAIVVFQRLLTDYPNAKEGEPALYSMLTCYADLNRGRLHAQAMRPLPCRFPRGSECRHRGLSERRLRAAGGRPQGCRQLFRHGAEPAAGQPIPRADALPAGQRPLRAGQFEDRPARNMSAI